MDAFRYTIPGRRSPSSGHLDTIYRTYLCVLNLWIISEMTHSSRVPEVWWQAGYWISLNWVRGLCAYMRSFRSPTTHEKTFIPPLAFAQLASSCDDSYLSTLQCLTHIELLYSSSTYLPES